MKTDETSATSTAVAARLRLVLVRLVRAMRRHGSIALTQSQLSALATLEELGPLRISSLAALESVGPSVATRVVASLEDEGYLLRSDDPIDKRASVVELSPKGRDVLANLWIERTIGLSSRIDRLTKAERDSLEAVLPILEKLARDG